MRRAREADPALFRVRVVLWVVLVATALRLVIGDDPWTGGVAARVAENRHVRAVDFARTWGWWSAAAATPVIALLLATVPRWLDRDPPPVVDALARPAGPSRPFVAALLGLVLFGAWLGAPRMSYSLFEDERYNVQWSIDGFYYRDHDGELRRHDPTWRDALWYYEWPNNHVPNTLLARASLGIWRVATHPGHRMVSEAAIRMPALLFGLASIAAIALLGWRLGHPGAGLAAAALLMLHPWHLRYLGECRGYSLVLLGLSLTPLLLVRSLHHGTWPRWAAFGAAEFVMMWTYPSIAWFLVFLNAAAGLWLWRRHRRTGHLGPQLRRLALVNLAAALTWFRVMAPNLAQLRIYLQNRGAEDVMNRGWLRDVWSFTVAGMPWGHFTENPHYTELSDRAAAHPTLVWGFAAALAGLAALGAARWLLAGGLRAWLVPVLTLPPIVLATSTYRAGQYLHPHYLVIALPGLALLVALGCETLARPLGTRAGVCLVTAMLVGFAAFTQAPRRELRSRPIQPWRDSVLATRPSVDPLDPRNAAIITVSFNMPANYYDAGGYHLREPDQLLYWLHESDRTGHPLFVNLGRPKGARRKHREMMAIVDARFDRVGQFEGLLSRGYREVYRYRGAGAQ